MNTVIGRDVACNVSTEKIQENFALSGIDNYFCILTCFFMLDDKFHNKYRISSARAQWHDYNGGLYFVTVCTCQKLHYFGNIAENEIILSEIGKYTAKCIEEIPAHFSNAKIPLYVVMPNHIHLIVAIDNVPKNNNICRDINISRDAIYDVSTEMSKDTGTVKNNEMQTIANKCGSLSHIIGKLKSAITRYAYQNQIEFGWQSRFYDHIIRNFSECNRIAEYIENNVILWDMDELNK